MIGQDAHAVAGSRCATHPEAPAAITCARCGNYACEACVADLHAASPVCRDCAARSDQGAYYVVPPWRVPAFYALTFGVYGLWWFYKNWQAIKRRDRSSIWPFARAFFSQFSYFSLIQDLNVRSRLKPQGFAGSVRDIGTGPAAGFFLMGMLYRLPDPYWCVTLVAGLCLLPAAQRIAELEGPKALEINRPLRARHYALIAFCALIAWPLVLYGMLAPP